MVIMVLLAGLAVPSFSGSLRTERLRTGARMIVSAIQLARGRAIAEGCYTRVELDETEGVVTLSRLEDPTAEEPSWTYMDDSLARPRELPAGVTLAYAGSDANQSGALGEAASSAAQTLEFRPDGTTDDATIVLEGYEEERLVIEVDDIRLAPRILENEEAAAFSEDGAR